MPRTGLVGAFALAMILEGCASIGPTPRAPAGPAQEPGADCGSWLLAVDQAVAAAGVSDAGAYRVPEFRYLRVDRFLSSFRAEALRDPALFEPWANAARALDREGRNVELRNLPAEALRALGTGAAEEAMARTDSCAGERMRADFAERSARDLALTNAVVPDDYDSLSRFLGLYPLTRIPFAQGVEHWHKDAMDAFSRYSGGERVAAATIRYMAIADNPMSHGEVAALLSSPPSGALGLLDASEAQLERLFGTFAPMLEVETEGEFDRIGTMRLTAGGRPAVETDRAVVYRRLAYTRFKGDVLPQLVYTAWFPERPRSSALDVLAGKLDGLVFRVTLARDGSPLIYDAIHPCGCYHMFFPTARLRPLPAPVPRDEWAFIPESLPDVRPEQRVTLHLQARTHYLTGISVTDTVATEIYSLADEDQLRSLPAPGGGRRSIYSPDGLVAGSERLERLLFWPMGVPSAGTMRQWGHHATAFLGVRHFDEAFLIQDRFEISSP